MWVRKRIDIAWSDLWFGIRRCCFPPAAEDAGEQLSRYWSPRCDAIPTLSVRSGFDLLLSALDLPRGSEVLISAITIPDMVRILRDHALVPVPVDLDPRQAAPPAAAWEAALTPATRAVVVTHLFGSRVPLEPVLSLARRHDLTVIEDCAQAFDGSTDRGHAQADVSMFSFGPIKTATALGGGMIRVRDAELRRTLAERQQRLPRQSGRAYLSRLLKYALIKRLGTRRMFSAVFAGCRLVFGDADRFINGRVRGFAGADFFPRIRRQPSAALLATLLRRLQTCDAARLADRARKGQWLQEALCGRVSLPGVECDPHNHWVFPIVVDDPQAVMAALRREGFDATQGQSLCVVDPPEGRPLLEPDAARAMLANLVFLPLYPDLPQDEVERMAKVLLDVCGPPRHLPRPAGTVVAAKTLVSSTGVSARTSVG